MFDTKGSAVFAGFAGGLIAGVVATALVLQRDDAPASGDAESRAATKSGALAEPLVAAASHTESTTERANDAPTTEATRAPVTAAMRPAPRAVPDILAALRESAANDAGPVTFQLMLEELLNSGPDGPRLVVDAFLDPALACESHSRAFSSVLAKIDDPRIAPAACGWLASNLAAGDDSWVHTHGYLGLIGAKGGREEQKTLLAALNASGQLASGAARSVAGLAGRGVDPKPYLDVLEQPRLPTNASELATSLAQWKDPIVDDKLWQAAAGPNAANGQIDEALTTIARRDGDAALERFRRDSASAASSEQKAQLLPALFGYRESADGLTDAGRRRFEDEALRVLGSGDMKLTGALATKLRYAEGAASPALVDGIARLAAGTLDESQREIFADCQKALAKDLKKQAQSASASK